ncbi:hypothetical protein QUW63_12080 [Pseudoflavonifractor phocaeensis]|nr:hypothetical protein [Pseudoflavonifractor phocaeensis]
MKETQEGCLSRAIITNFARKICSPANYSLPGLAKNFLQSFALPLRP